ncbi:zinc ribbon domain-containing protein [Thiobacillus sp.]|uniref:zinc ribbon domain-containing protein n=1 Tax=Thiobacillus sp. TaxID=924 RepID=UPI00341DD1F6
MGAMGVIQAIRKTAARQSPASSAARQYARCALLPAMRRFLAAAKCSGCGAELTADAQFCGQCGKPRQ